MTDLVATLCVIARPRRGRGNLDAYLRFELIDRHVASLLATLIVSAGEHQVSFRATIIVSVSEHQQP
jgi:hypothetical protein